VVYKLFKIVGPDMAFFGQKDYQQFLVIRKMMELLSLPVKLVMCPILRENDGLAMSSRNIHLSDADRSHALILSSVLFWLRDQFNISATDELAEEAIRKISREADVTLDYFEIADGLTLYKADGNSTIIVALVAAKVGNTRLIDNVILKD
jgi:pantoate--beta-alanine ligase